MSVFCFRVFLFLLGSSWRGSSWKRRGLWGGEIERVNVDFFFDDFLTLLFFFSLLPVVGVRLVFTLDLDDIGVSNGGVDDWSAAVFH